MTENETPAEKHQPVSGKSASLAKARFSGVWAMTLEEWVERHRLDGHDPNPVPTHDNPEK